jgi:ClpP class serine protease
VKRFLYSLLIWVVLPAGLARADTFVHIETGKVYHGFAVRNPIDGVADVNTMEKGVITLNLNQFKITRDRTGRNNTVALISVLSAIEYGMETRAFESALVDAAAKGPLFILIEIDSPGGRVDLAMRMSTAIQRISNCDVYAYINDGAYSAAVAVSLACDKIYMAPVSVIGDATVITMDASGNPIELRTVVGETIGEKIGSAWRNYLASMAENKNRPAALAKAMENKEIEVVEIIKNGERVFVESENQKPDDTVVKVWSKKGLLLTLTAEEAVNCGMADKIYENRQALLKDLDALSAKLIPDKSMAEARRLCARIERSLDKINASVDLGIKQVQATKSRGQAMRAMKSLINDAQFVLGLKRKFGNDVPVDEKMVQDFLNTVQAEYDALRTMP